MIHFAIRFATLATFSDGARGIAGHSGACRGRRWRRWRQLGRPDASLRAVAGTQRQGDPHTHSAKKKPSKQSLFDDPVFAKGYREAYSTIYDRQDYSGAIEQLRALGHDDFANVANLIGYSYRKLGDYKLSQVWYERALKADPNHVLTWQYYGLWQIERGNRD